MDDGTSRECGEAGLAPAIGRRRFLGSAAAAAATALVSVASLGFGSRSMVLMAVGGAGARVAGLVPTLGFDPALWLWDGGGGGKFVPPGTDRRIRLVQVAEGLGGELDRELALLGPTRAHVAVVVGLGGMTGSRFTPGIVAALLRHGVRPGVFCGLPFRFEGEPRLRAAERARSELERSLVAMQVFRNDDLLAGARDRTLAAILSQSDERIAHAVRDFLLD